MNKLIEWLEAERNYHKQAEGESTTSWDRGYHAGIHTEIGRIIIKAREFMEAEGNELKKFKRGYYDCMSQLIKLNKKGDTNG